MSKVTIRGELKKAGKGLLDEFCHQLFGGLPKPKPTGGGNNGGGNHYHVHHHWNKEKPQDRKPRG